MSALATARQRGLEVATRQTTFGWVFMQKPSADRQNSDSSYQLQRVSRQTFPPMVPMLRSCGVLTRPAAVASARYRERIVGCSAIVVSVALAPISVPFAGPSASTSWCTALRSEMSTSGVNCRRFMFG